MKVCWVSNSLLGGLYKYCCLSEASLTPDNVFVYIYYIVFSIDGLVVILRECYFTRAKHIIDAELQDSCPTGWSHIVSLMLSKHLWLGAVTCVPFIKNSFTY